MLLGVKVLGLKGAALAAFGDKPDGFAADPFTASVGPLLSEVGVKLGESTFSRFLELNRPNPSPVNIHTLLYVSL